MDAQLFIQDFKPSGEAESSWLTDVFNFVSENLCPVLPESNRVSPHQLSLSVVEKIREHMCVKHTLPVSYKFVSIAELLSLQHLPCVSNLSWSTSQHRTWAKEAVLALPDHQALTRINLLLIGCLTVDPSGDWKLMDASGGVSCQFQSPSQRWLNCPVFLPHWNYIPHNSSGSNQDSSSGHVEVIGSPVPLCVSPELRLSSEPGKEPELCRAVGLKETMCLLSNRTPRQRFSVCGRVGSVCPLLVVSRTSFFCFSLTDDIHSLPILVKDPSKLWWAQCVSVGQHLCVTALRVCVLQGWRGKSILCVTGTSEMHTGHTHTFDTHADSEPDTPASLTTSRIPEDDENQPDAVNSQSAVKTKSSKVIDYQGIVTEVVSEGAGLYVIDRRVGLCLAYQPSLRRKLRAGDTVEVSHVHFLYRPSPDFPKVMLATCLRSNLRVTAFSRVVGPTLNARCPDDGALTRLFLEKNLGVSEYLWSCHMSSQLSHSLVPTVFKQQCVCLLSWKLLECVRGRQRERVRRDIYSEMLDQSHTCPLSQYSTNPSAPQYISVAELSQSLLSDCWTVSLSSLLPPSGPSLTSAEINSALSWSCKTVSSDQSEEGRPGQRPLLLVGVLALPSQKSEQSVQLRDGTGAVACVLTESDQTGQQSAVFNTAWIGCLVCVQKFTMTTERCLQSDFPSYQHLQQDKYITNKSCRIYLQFSLDHVHILSPSAAMATLVALKVEKLGDSVTEGNRKEEEGDEGSATVERKKRRTEEKDFAPPAAVSLPGRRTCVSIVIRLESKEGVAWRNTEVQQSEGEAGLVLCFSARAAVVGPVVTWEHNPKNAAMTEKETQPQKEVQLLCLVFAGAAARWSAVLQPGFFYRLIATDTQDCSVFTDSGVCAQTGVQLHMERTVQVHSDWRFHTLTHPLLLPSHRQALSPKVLTVTEVLNCSSDLVCFQALLCERTCLTDRTGDKTSGVRLTVCDQKGRSLQVYMDLSHSTHPLGLIPGNTLLFSAFQRRMSRTGSVYCRFLPVSSASVLSTAGLRATQPPSPPTMHLGRWEGSSVGQVKGHVVCFLTLQLQWSCSLCGSVFKQSCSSHQCLSTSSVFQPKAKVVIDDGTGEAHVRVSSTMVQPLLGLADGQWEGLQRAVKVRGHMEVKPWQRSLTCDSDEPLLNFLLSVLSGEAVCRQLLLTCRTLDNQRPEEMKRFSRRDRDFMTRMKRPLQLTCLSLTCLSAHA